MPHLTCSCGHKTRITWTRWAKRQRTKLRLRQPLTYHHTSECFINSLDDNWTAYRMRK